MSQFNRINAEQRSNLVAYLDGELVESRAGEVEQLLSRSEVARHDVEMLSRTFDMLDLLPKEKADENFTQRTLSTIAALDQQKPVSQQTWFVWSRRTVMSLVWGVGLIAALYFGFIAGAQWFPTESQKMINDLDFLEKIHLYEEIEDENSLRQLKGFLRQLDEASFDGTTDESNPEGNHE